VKKTLSPKTLNPPLVGSGLAAAPRREVEKEL